MIPDTSIGSLGVLHALLPLKEALDYDLKLILFSLQVQTDMKNPSTFISFLMGELFEKNLIHPWSI